jgi:hypothetical protein
MPTDAIQPGATAPHLGKQPPAAVQFEPADPRREEIIRYIKARIGPELSSVYADAMRSSVELGIYDLEWVTSSDRVRTNKYADNLVAHWMSEHQHQSYLLMRLLIKLEHGTDSEKQQLKKLLDIVE